MAIGQQVNTQRALTIAGAVALIAFSAYGVWKWNKTDLRPQQPPTGNQDEKKKKTLTRQVDINDKVEKQSHTPTEEEEEQVQVVQEKVIIVEENEKENDEKVVVVEEEKVQVTIAEPTVLAEEEFAEAIAELTADGQVIDEEYVVVDATTATITSTIKPESCATSSTDETDVWTPEHEIISSNDDDSDHKNTPETTAADNTTTAKEYIWKADASNNLEEKKSDWSSTIIADEQIATPNNNTETEAAAESTNAAATAATAAKPLSLYAPVFVPRQQQQQAQQPKKSIKKRLSRAELIEQQRQNHTPHAKARCSHWPRCTNKNCKFWHPFRDCREGENCPFGNKCMFIHPSDYAEPVRTVRKNGGSPTASAAASATIEEQEQINSQFIQQQSEQQQFQFAS